MLEDSLPISDDNKWEKGMLLLINIFYLLSFGSQEQNGKQPFSHASMGMVTWLPSATIVAHGFTRQWCVRI